MHARPLLFIPVIVLFAACGDDDGQPATDAADTTEVTETSQETADDTAPDTTPDDVADTLPGDTDEPVAADAIFAFSAAPGQHISAGPFPSNALLGPGGTVDLAPLGDDVRFSRLANANILARTDARIATRSAFGFISSVFFPMNAEPDLTTFTDAVRYVALSGPEEGKVFPGTASWFSHADYLAVFPAWGHYLVPGAKYAVVIDTGVKAADGRLIEPPPAFAQLVTTASNEGEEPDPATEAFADLRAWLSTRDESPVIATVFTTEATMPYLDALFAAADAFSLEPPTANMALTEAGTWVVAAPVAGADLDAYFGVAEAPFAVSPGVWYPGNRADAALLPGGAPYAGGTFRGEVAYVVNGTFVSPAFNLDADDAGADAAIRQAPIAYEGGVPTARGRALVPFTVYLCADHLTGGAPDPAKTVPIALFVHGGTALRSDAVPYAVANCAAGYATVSFDLPYHGGRQEVAWADDDGVIASIVADQYNTYSGKSAGDAGFVPDYVGDNGGATTSVGGLFSLASQFDPDIIEANLITIATDAHVLTRYIKDTGPNGLGAFLGTNLDASHLVIESLSFGTSFTSALMAGSTDYVAAVQSVGSSGILGLNLPMAPNNAILAGGIIRTIYGLASTLAEVNAAAHTDPVIAMVQWLSQKGDSSGYAPFVLRHRQDDHALHVYGTGDSWDETLFSPAQLSFNAAWGVPVFTAGADWTVDATIPGAATIDATPHAAPISDNLTYGARTQTAGYFYNNASCHAQVITPICKSTFEPPYPPAVERAAPLITLSPLCAMHAPLIPFLADVLGDRAPSLAAPNGTCEDLYAP